MPIPPAYDDVDIENAKPQHRLAEGILTNEEHTHNKEYGYRRINKPSLLPPEEYPEVRRKKIPAAAYIKYEGACAELPVDHLWQHTQQAAYGRGHYMAAVRFYHLPLLVCAFLGLCIPHDGYKEHDGLRRPAHSSQPYHISCECGYTNSGFSMPAHSSIQH